MNDYWNDPPEVDDGIRECPRCKDEVEFSDKFQSLPIYRWDVQLDDSEERVYRSYHDRTQFAFVCPTCGHQFIVTD
jgi:endogenous inhibitor of DNA gyrase (YacG/DUF329 family)